jgi:hypothetical protein
MSLMVKSKIERLKSVFQEHELSLEEQNDQAKILLSDKDMLKRWEDDQLPHWELICGLTLLCGMISHRREEILNQISKKTSCNPPI